MTYFIIFIILVTLMGFNFDINAYLEKIGLPKWVHKTLSIIMIVFAITACGLWVASSIKNLTEPSINRDAVINKLKYQLDSTKERYDRFIFETDMTNTYKHWEPGAIKMGK